MHFLNLQDAGIISLILPLLSDHEKHFVPNVPLTDLPLCLYLCCLIVFVFWFLRRVFLRFLRPIVNCDRCSDASRFLLGIKLPPRGRVTSGSGSRSAFFFFFCFAESKQARDYPISVTIWQGKKHYWTPRNWRRPSSCVCEVRCAVLFSILVTVLTGRSCVYMRAMREGRLTRKIG